ncbi:MAG: NYN domain-containing protein [Candidatus Competibacter sp.]|nr:NYN domain-containing protein [Candidatus Contendobacter sp.]MDS4042032.1 NYN domain-containing protein [Candidatus Competibacter sp.]
MNPKLVAKIESEEPKLRLAVLIDADNISADVVEGLLTEIASFGEATVKRIYGDFTTQTSSKWKQCLNRYAIKPVQQFAYTTGKNATDSTLIIDAMDLLYTKRFDGFCLVSSDSDFTGLATRIREEGLLVLGFGEKKTPEAFRNACHKFILTEILKAVASQNNISAMSPGKAEEAKTSKQMAAIPLVEKSNSVEQGADNKELPLGFILEALARSYDDTGWANLANFGSFLTKIKPDFDARIYGFKKLSDLVKQRKDVFEIEERSSKDLSTKILYLREKK